LLWALPPLGEGALPVGTCHPCALTGWGGALLPTSYLGQPVVGELSLVGVLG